MDNNNLNINSLDNNNWKRVIFYYVGGEKTILTINISQKQLDDICSTLANSSATYVMIDIGTVKNDIILINKDKFIFMMSSSITKEEAEKALTKGKDA